MPYVSRDTERMLTETYLNGAYQMMDNLGNVVPSNRTTYIDSSQYRDRMRTPARPGARYRDNRTDEAVTYDRLTGHWFSGTGVRRVRVNSWNVVQAPRAGRPRKVVPGEEEVHQTLDKRSCPCEVCKVARFQPSKIGRAVVHGYSDSPRGGWKTKKVANDPFDYFLGVELETDASYGQGPSRRNRYGEFTRDMVGSDFDNGQAADMREPKNLWYPKRDGSVTGPEFASHPATFTYWKSQKKKIESMFTHLLHAGYRSHDNDTCGMHVNISRTAFDSSRHLYRFLTLIHSNVGWSLRMSQRTKKSAEHWAPLDSFKNKDYRKSVATQAMMRNSLGNLILNAVSTDKYSALNMPYGQPRFEFRLPRGTLRIDRFFKNLEWTVAMIEFTRKGLIIEARPKNFMAWVMERVDEYPNLAAFLVEKKMVVKA